MFYLKMKGDYYRYLSEVASEDKKKGKDMLSIRDVFTDHVPTATLIQLITRGQILI